MQGVVAVVLLIRACLLLLLLRRRVRQLRSAGRAHGPPPRHLHDARLRRARGSIEVVRARLHAQVLVLQHHVAPVAVAVVVQRRVPPRAVVVTGGRQPGADVRVARVLAQVVARRAGAVALAPAARAADAAGPRARAGVAHLAQPLARQVGLRRGHARDRSDRRHYHRDHNPNRRRRRRRHDCESVRQRRRL